LEWDAVTEAGQVVVSNKINIHCALELVKQAEVKIIAEKETAHEIEA
jgi:hypothetical protein